MAHPAIFINQTGSIGVIFEYLTYNVTGDLFLSLLVFLMVILALAIILRIPIEWTGIILFPLVLAMVSWNAPMLPVFGILVIWFAVLIAKNFFYK